MNNVNVTTNHYQLQIKPAMKVQSCHLLNHINMQYIYKCTFMHCWLLGKNLLRCCTQKKEVQDNYVVALWTCENGYLSIMTSRSKYEFDCNRFLSTRYWLKSTTRNLNKFTITYDTTSVALLVPEMWITLTKLPQLASKIKYDFVYPSSCWSLLRKPFTVKFYVNRVFP